MIELLTQFTLNKLESFFTMLLVMRRSCLFCIYVCMYSCSRVVVVVEFESRSY